jgi:hypothetical protein
MPKRAELNAGPGRARPGAVPQVPRRRAAAPRGKWTNSLPLQLAVGIGAWLAFITAGTFLFQ